MACRGGAVLGEGSRSWAVGCISYALLLVLPTRMRSSCRSCESAKSMRDAAPEAELGPSLCISRDRGKLPASFSCDPWYRELRLPPLSSPRASWLPCRCRGPLEKFESRRNPPDLRTRCFRRAKSSSCTESLASKVPDAELPAPLVAPVPGRESWLRRGEELPSPLSVYAPALLAMYVCEDVVQRSESPEGRP